METFLLESSCCRYPVRFLLNVKMALKVFWEYISQLLKTFFVKYNIDIKLKNLNKILCACRGKCVNTHIVFCSCLPLMLAFSEHVKKYIFRFIWNDKPETIKRSYLYNWCGNGSLGLICLSTVDNCIIILIGFHPNYFFL